MAPIEPIPLKFLKSFPFFFIIFPGDSFVPANKDPIITASAPAARAFDISPENLIPPSAIIETFFLPTPFLTAKIALSWGTPMPATNRVVRIDPGPIPTLITSAPSLIKNFAASVVAIFPAHKVVFFDFNFFIFLIISPTFFVCP